MVQVPRYFILPDVLFRGLISFSGFPVPCQDPLVKNILEAGARNFAKPVVKKEPITPDMITAICSKYASPSADLCYHSKWFEPRSISRS